MSHLKSESLRSQQVQTIGLKSCLKEDNVQASTAMNIRQLISAMTQLINMNRERQNKQLEIKKASQAQMLEPRDRAILIDLPDVDSLTQDDLQMFVSQLCKKVWSISFNTFSNKQLSFQHTKVYASEQILRNIVRLSEKFQLSRQDFAIINKHIQGRIVDYMWYKYPITLSRQVSQNLNKIVNQTNRLNLPQNSYLHNVPFSFVYRESGEYNDLIMRTINEVLKRTNSRLLNYTIYERFQWRVKELFQLVTDCDYMEEKEKEDKERQRSVDSLDELEIFGKMSINLQASLYKKETIEETYKARESKSLANKAKYREKVQSYTNFKIGRKIPDSTSSFTDQEIASHNIKIINPQMLRLLTKWCQELERKFFDFQYLQGMLQAIRAHNKGIEMSIKQMRQFLKELLSIEKGKIDLEMSQLIENNFMMESDLLKRELSMQHSNDIQYYQLIAARYSCGIVNNLHSYTIKYLNRLIHGLLASTSKFSKYYSNINTSIDIITFQIMDLFRCRCVSGEKEIIRIYNEIIDQSGLQESNIELVRVVNRLQKGTNDVLINVRYRNVLCQIQLAVNSKNSNFIQFSNSFNHYFYEIKRSPFGPVTELCSIWKCLDPRFQLYPTLPQLAVTPSKLIYQSGCIDHELSPYFKPFLCSICFHHFYDNIFIKNHLKCKKCDFWVCARCQINRSDCLNILSAAFKQQVVSKCSKIQMDEDIPQYGICILIHCFQIKIEPFKKFTSRDEAKIMGVNNKKVYEIFDISRKQQIGQFREKHLIFRIDQDYGKKHIKIDEDQVKEFLTQEKLRTVYMKHSDKICINQEKLNSQQLASLCSFGNTSQRLAITQIQLIGNELENVDTMLKLFPNLITINLSENKLKHFSCIPILTKLQNLVLDSNHLEQLPPEIWTQAKLRELSAAKNLIRIIPSELGCLKQLKSLCLNRNKIEQLPPEIGKLNLLSLNLSDNEFKCISKEICQLSNLQILEMQNNRLSCVNSQIKGMNRLKWLNLSHNQITSFSEGLIHLGSLTKLNLSFNKIEVIPNQINDMHRLKELNLSHNNLNNLQNRVFPQIKMLYDLLHLDLSHNNLQISPRFSQFSSGINFNMEMPERKLRFLSIANNKLTRLQSFENVQRLEELHLNCNQIQLLHESVNKLTNLSILHLQINNLRQLPCLVMNSLEKLTLSRNQLLKFEYHKLKELQELDLADNQLTQLGYNYMPKLSVLSLNRNLLQNLQLSEYSKLKQLFVSHNKMKEFPKFNLKSKLNVLVMDFNLIHQIPQQLGSFSELAILTLAQNQITTIPSRLKKLTSLQNKSLELNGNPIQIVDCWSFLCQKGTSATIKHLENCKKDTNSVEYQKQVTIGQIMGRQSDIESSR